MSDTYITRNQNSLTIGFSYQKYFFIFFAIFGFVFIWTTKLLGFPQFLITSIVVALIPIYCLLAYKSSSCGLREDQIGDNAYYLGFLYTLSSLSFALWKFSSQNIGTDIVSSFGVALWSTICGVALRVFLSQMYQDPNEIESGARVRIAQTADHLILELNQASTSFNTYSTNLRQSVDEAFSGMNAIINQNLTSQVEKFSAVTEEMSKQIQSSFDEFKSYSKKINNSSEKVINSVTNLYQKIDVIEAPRDVITSKIDNIFKEAEDSGKQLNAFSVDHVKSAEKVIQSSESLVKNIESLNSYVSLIKKSSEATADSLNNLESFSQKIHSLGASLENFSDNLTNNFESLLSKQKDATSGIAKHADELEKQLARSREYTEQTHNAIASMVKTLDNKLK